MAVFESRDDGVGINVKVVPGASRTRLLGESGDRVRIAVAAPPEKGKANKALCEYIARRLSVRKQDVRVVHGLTSPQKKIVVQGVSMARIRQALLPG